MQCACRFTGREETGACVRCTFEVRGGAAVTVEVDALIGCDGVRSAVREPSPARPAFRSAVEN